MLWIRGSEDHRYLPTGSRVPSLATHEVARVAPVHGVLAALAHGVLSVAPAVGPPGVEVAVVGTLRVGGDLALLESGDIGIFTLSEDVVAVWSGEDTNGSGAGKQERSERDHCCYRR
jgi:hypothetical protein